MHVCFISFHYTEMAQVVETLPHRKQEPSNLT